MTAPARIRVLIVDDSAFARKVLRLSLGTEASLEVVGTAGDGLEALEKIEELRPDVVTLDLVMPNLDGVGVMRALSISGKPCPSVVLVTMAAEDNELTVEALQLGAVGLVRKPTALATDRLYEISAELVAAVLAASTVRAPPLTGPVAARAVLAHEASAKVLVIGASTGGPQALTQVLSGLPANLPVPVAIGLHIPAEYTEALAKRLSLTCALPVVEAHDGARLAPGRVVLAKGGSHLTFHRDGAEFFARVSRQPASTAYFPSIDLLFVSAVEAWGSGVLAVVLTGMGDDGLQGARAIVAAGGRVLTEAESSCVVYGMPRAVKEAGLSAGEARISSMAEKIVSTL